MAPEASASKKMGQTKRYDTKDDRLQASNALRYEWRMLNECAARIPFYEKKDMIVCNALIEVFCVHLRNLIEFSHRNQKGKRPFWTEYLSSDKTTRLKNKLEKYEAKVNDLLSHLTYKRLRYTATAKSWPIGQIANEVNENMLQFIDTADQSLLSDEIKQCANQFESLNKAHDDELACSSGDYIRYNKDYTS
jgi:hypothetical protein